MARSPIKWVGGKHAIVPALREHMPSSYGDYYEPFVGGGALFFALSPLGDAHNAFLSDTNAELMNFYEALRRSPRALMGMLDDMAERHSEEYYYAVRAAEPTDALERAARFVFLNRTGYNGLWRVNRAGRLNVPWGHKKNPVRLYDEATFLECASVLNGTSLCAQQFDAISPSAGDFVYLDPPYDRTYNGYASDGFGVEGQERLAAFCHRLTASSVMVMESNSDTERVRSLYAGYHIVEVQAPRMISCRGDGRKPATEVLITNYDPETGSITGSAR